MSLNCIPFLMTFKLDLLCEGQMIDILLSFGSLHFRIYLLTRCSGRGEISFSVRNKQ